MRTPRFRTIIGLLSAPAIIAGGLTAFTLASAAPAAAGQPVTQPLTPPPPSFETCKTVGNGFICEGARTMTYGPDDTGITCGTGAAIPYTQHNTTTDILAVPGDFASATETVTGQNNFTVPHMGAVFLNAGRVVFGADGTLEFSAGPQGFIDYFFNGNTAAVAELCTALGAS